MSRLRATLDPAYEYDGDAPGQRQYRHQHDSRVARTRLDWQDQRLRGSRSRDESPDAGGVFRSAPVRCRSGDGATIRR